jgi:hypothetical protein
VDKISDQRNLTQRRHRNAFLFLLDPHLLQSNDLTSLVVNRSIHNALRPFAEFLTLREVLHHECRLLME